MRRSGIKTVWYLLWILAGSELLATTLPMALPEGECRWLLATLCLTSALVLLYSRGSEPPLAPGQLQSALLAGLGVLAVLTWHLPVTYIATHSLHFQLALGVGILVFSAGGLIQLLTRFTDDPPFSSWMIFCLAVLLASAPLWTGPAVDLIPSPLWGTNLIIAFSPLSYLASLAEWDYLRGEWFYRHSPFGGLRYEYPSAAIASIVYVGIGLVSRYLANLLNRPSATTDARAGISQATP
ncbi:MAG: hypothetical protein KDI63_11515 [Gammaproteobacteria bacterium]|nr:hypothetical protein [Gammaproteobacteria bacterium]